MYALQPETPALHNAKEGPGVELLRKTPLDDVLVFGSLRGGRV